MARLTLINTAPQQLTALRQAAFQLTDNAFFNSAEQIYTTTFTDLNGSGVFGYAVVGLDEQTNRMTVSIHAEGLEANEQHAQHIHGFLDDLRDAMLPTAAQDDDGDGFIELAEGTDTYGPVLLDLTVDGNNGQGMGGDDDAMSPFADEDGVVDYTETFRLPEGDLDADPKLDLREIVLHGMTLEEGEGSGPGEADGTAGYKAILPVAAGELERVRTADEFNDSVADGMSPPDDEPSQLAVLAAEITDNDDFLEADKFYFTSYQTLNDSGVTGVAIIGLDTDTDTITVAIRARGLEEGQEHIQHIHGFMADDDGDVQEAMTPTMDEDEDGDGFIELGEAADIYGPILLTLGDGDGGMDTTPPMLDDDGSVWFVESYELPAGDLSDDPMLELRELVIHGMTLEAGEGSNGGEADGTAGYKAILPVASGELDEVADVGELGILLAINAFTDINPNSLEAGDILMNVSSFG